MAETKTAVEKIKEKAGKPTLSIKDLIEKSAKELGKALPSHLRPERIVRIALTTLKTNPKLYQCNPQSFLGALFQCAQLGLEPNVEGQAYIIPYENRKTGELVAQFQIGYKGLVELYWRHQSADTLTMETVCEHDAFEYNLGDGSLKHSHPPFGKPRGEVIGYYASAKMTSGGRTIKVMSKLEAYEWGKRYSQCWDRKANDFRFGTPWKDNFDSMALKTVLKQLMKLLPKSIEIQKALSMDETVKTKIEADMFEVPNEAEYIPPTEEPQKEEAKQTVQNPDADEIPV